MWIFGIPSIGYYLAIVVMCPVLQIGVYGLMYRVMKPAGIVFRLREEGEGEEEEEMEEEMEVYRPLMG